jgi:hypothetical protein
MMLDLSTEFTKKELWNMVAAFYTCALQADTLLRNLWKEIGDAYPFQIRLEYHAYLVASSNLLKEIEEKYGDRLGMVDEEETESTDD